MFWFWFVLLGVTNAETRHDEEVVEEAMAAADTSARAAEEGVEDFMVILDKYVLRFVMAMAKIKNEMSQ